MSIRFSNPPALYPEKTSLQLTIRIYADRPQNATKCCYATRWRDDRFAMGNGAKTLVSVVVRYTLETKVVVSKALYGKCDVSQSLPLTAADCCCGCGAGREELTHRVPRGKNKRKKKTGKKIPWTDSAVGGKRRRWVWVYFQWCSESKTNSLTPGRPKNATTKYCK